MAVTVSRSAEPTTAAPAASETLRSLRRAVLTIFVVSVVGAAADLLLTEHYEDLWQLAPLALFAASLVVLAWHGARRDRASLRTHQALMVLFIVSGFVGLVLHFQANVEFEREMYPDLSGPSLVWKAVRGTSPPSLAPGAMIALGLLGLAYAYRHPTFASNGGTPANTSGVPR